MTPLIRKVNDQRGQMLVMLVLTLSVTFIIGFITIDFGLWFSERRGAQKDADLSALAAAQELLSITKLSDGNALAVQDDANARALEYAALNDVTDPDNVHLPDPSDSALWTACWEDIGDTSDVLDTYPLDIGHPTGALFGTIFGFTGLEDLGAHARACVGSVISQQGVMPIGVPINNPDFERWSRELCWSPDDSDPDNLPEPLYGKRCDLSVTDKVSGEASWLDLDHPSGDPSDDCSVSGGGANELRNEIEAGGANTWCYVAPPGSTAADCDDDLNWCARSKTGAQTNTIMRAFNDLFDSEGDCDGNGDGIDDFDDSIELVSGTPETDSAFYKVTCDSPRLITLVIVDNFDPSGQSLMPIRAFASFFVEACYNDNDGTEYPKCDPNGQIGQFNLVGRFVNILGIGGVGYPTDWSPKRVILDQ